MSMIYTLILILVLAWVSSEDDTVRIQTKFGAAIGTVRETEEGGVIYSYQGIPYAKPPIGNLRFKPPQPIDPWTDELLATTDDIICVQKLAGPLMGKEDCLILNVYTPMNPSVSPPSEPLSVMVFFHGGGFIGGWSGTSFVGHPDYLLQHNVVLVTVNYRVGVMGFLSTEDEVAPGNYGLLDQLEALRWIKENIATFGGNPNEVTIFGESAGGACAHLLMLSPHAKGLFHRVIAQSGTNLTPGSMTYLAKANAQELARKVDCPDVPSQKLVECLQGIDADRLVDTDITDPSQKIGIWPIVWSPRIDSEAYEPVLPKHPIELMKSGEYERLPLLIGHASSEGGGFLLMGGEYYDLTVNTITKDWDHFCKLNFAIREYLVSEDMGSELCEKLKETYIDSSKDFEENKMAYADLIGDAALTSGIYKSSELMSRHSPVYNYIFDYESKEYFLLKLLFSAANKVDGLVSHGDDLMYIFKYPQTGWTKESPEYEMVTMMSGIWTNFAKTGEASISELHAPWPEASWPNHSYVIIDSDPSIEQDYRIEKMKTLNSLFNYYMYKTVDSNSNKDEL